MRKVAGSASVAALFCLLATGVAFGAPPEVLDLRFLNKDDFEWSPAPTADAYNVYRGDVSLLPGNYGTCLLQETPSTTASDSTTPASGDVNFYLVTSTKGAHEGVMGYDSSGIERPNSSPCFPLPTPLLYLLDPNGPDTDGVWQGKEAPRNPGIANDLTGLAGGGLYLHTGEYFVREVDLEIPGRGMNWRHVRTYRSQINHKGQQGMNWTYNYDRRIHSGGAGLVYLDGTGREDEYVLGAGGLYEPVEQGIYSKILENADGTFTLRERDGTLYHHDSLLAGPTAGLLLSIEDRLGNRMTFQYYANGLLRSAVDTMGRLIEYYWNHDGRLHTVTDHTGREVRYEYDAQGDLISVRSPIVVGTSTGNDFPAGKTKQYTYSSGTGAPELDHNLLTVTAPGDTVPAIDNTFNNADELVNQFHGGTNLTGIPAGGLFQYAITKPGSGYRDTEVIDRSGFRRVFMSDPDGHVIQEEVHTVPVRPTDPAVFITGHDYNAQGERTQTTHPEGNEVFYEWDSSNPDIFQRGNLMSVLRVADAARGDGFGGALADIAVYYEYEPLYTQQRVIVDPAGRSSEYIYDYQEGDPVLNGADDIAVTWDIDLTTVPTLLGDRNDDGQDLLNFGNPVVLRQPDASLWPGGRQELFEGGPVQKIRTRYWYNDLGQVRLEIDAESNVKLHVYHPETDPDGNGDLTPPPADGRLLDPTTGGYLASTTLDTDPVPYLPAAEVPRRDNGTSPTPAEIANDFLYDPAGNLIESIDGEGVKTSFEVNALGQIVSVRRGATSFRSTNNDSDPPLNGFLAEQDYNERDEMISRRIEDLGDLSNTGGMIDTEFEYDILGNVVRMHQEVGGGIFALTEYRYDPQEHRTATILPEGNIQTLQFDERGLLYKLVRNDDDLDASNGSVFADASFATYNYDLNGNLAEFVDGNSGIWPFVHDGMDRRVRSDIFHIDSFFDVFYNPDETIDRIRVITSGGTTLYDTRYEYDELGRVTELRQAILDPTGALIPEDFDADGWVSVVTEYDRNSRRSRVWTDDREIQDLDHDGAGRLVHKVDALNNHVHLTYDRNNNVVETLEEENSGPVAPEVFTSVNAWDRLNRLTTSTDDLGNVKTLTWDSRDNLIGLEDTRGNTIGYSYDGCDRRIETTRDMRSGGAPPGPITGTIVYGYEYDLNGRAIAMTDPEGNVTTYSYDGLDRKITDWFDDGTSMSYAYDFNDNVIEVTDANGSIITIDYDSADRLTKRTVAPAPGVHTISQTYSYDPLNRLILAADEGSGGPAERTEVEFEYDSLNRVRRESSTFGAGPPRTLTYNYDGDGNRLDATYPSGIVLNYSYDPLNRLVTVHNGVPAGYQADYTYIGPERVAERRHDNGTRKSYLDSTSSTDLGYDPLKRVVRVTHFDPTSTAQADTVYTRDPVGSILNEEYLHAGRDDRFEYDSAYRLVHYERDVGTAAPTTIDYTLDRVGNWLERKINGQPFGNTPNNLNEYDEPQSGGTRVDDGIPDDFDDDLNTPTADGVNLGHDMNGDLITEGDLEYQYDALHRLVWVYDAGVQVAHYVYDGLNRRMVKQDYTTGDDDRFVYDGDNLVEVRDQGSGALEHRYYYGAGGELVSVEHVTDGAYYYVHDDARGSIVMVTDAAAAIVERIAYDAHGEPRFEDASSNATGMTESLVGNRFLYQGKFWDDETGLYEEKAAYFAPRFGRHIQRVLPGRHLGPQGLALNVPMFLPCPVNWIGVNPFWWAKGWFWHPGAWHCGYWAWEPGWWWGGPWNWWRWKPWVWFDHPFASWWTVKPWVFWWHHPFRWWGWRTWWPWPGWWGHWPYWGLLGWSHWIPVWGWTGWQGWWPWWGFKGWAGFWPTFGWFGWKAWWPWWNDWWGWHPQWWWGWWTWSPFWWHGFWGWAGLGFWRWCWGWLHWWPWGWWNWAGWLPWWGWFGWNPWWWWGWWSWWTWGMIRGFYWWWGPLSYGPWFCSWWPWWWWGWWGWLVPWGCWLLRIGWFGFWGWGGWWAWWHGWWLWPWWGWTRWWGWWWPWWGWW